MEKHVSKRQKKQYVERFRVEGYVVSTFTDDGPPEVPTWTGRDTAWATIIFVVGFGLLLAFTFWAMLSWVGQGG